nr:MAG TPA: hypothetical protein [Caudoviricetes sp.]DAX63574.1 MAG TPA: hypothetical protein [Caudoviricetes sp.]
MIRGQRLYNKTHTLPIREGFFYCAETLRASSIF